VRRACRIGEFTKGLGRKTPGSCSFGEEPPSRNGIHPADRWRSARLSVYFEVYPFAYRCHAEAVASHALRHWTFALSNHTRVRITAGGRSVSPGCAAFEDSGTLVDLRHRRLRARAAPGRDPCAGAAGERGDAKRQAWGSFVSEWRLRIRNQTRARKADDVWVTRS
jgi:hypothetical protein